MRRGAIMLRRRIIARISVQVPGRPSIILAIYRVRGEIPPDQVDNLRLIIRMAGAGVVVSEPVESVREGLKRGLALVAARL